MTAEVFALSRLWGTVRNKTHPEVSTYYLHII